MEIKKTFKRSLSAILAAMIAVSMFAGLMVTANAAESTYNLTINGTKVEVKKGTYNSGLTCNYNRLYKLKDKYGETKTYFYNYDLSRINKYLNQFETTEMSDKLRNKMKDELMYAAPCSGYIYDNKTKFGFAYNTENHWEISGEVFYTTRLFFFQIVTEHENLASPTLADRYTSSANIKAIGYFTSTLKNSGEEAAHTAKPYITSYRKKNVPVISATTSHKNVVFFSYTKSIYGGEKAAKTTGTKIDVGKFSDIAVDAVVSVITEDYLGFVKNYVIKPIAAETTRTFVDALFTNPDKAVEDEEYTISDPFTESNNCRSIAYFLSPKVSLTPKGINKRTNCTTPVGYNIGLRTVAGSIKSDYDYNTVNRKINYLYQFSVIFDNNYVGKDVSVNISIPDASEYKVSGMPSVSVNKSSTSLYAGKTERIIAKVSNYNNSSVTWSSSDNSIATVSSAGVVTGVKAGTATITAKKVINGTTISTSCKVTVNQLPLVSNFKVSATQQSVTATWSKMAAAAGYYLELNNKTTGKVAATKYITSNSTTSYKFGSLPENSKFSVTIKAYNLLNQKYYYGKASSSSVNTAKAVGAITNLYVETNLPDQITLGWNKVNDITAYRIDVKDNTGYYQTYDYNYESTSAKFTVKDLKQNHRYTISVKAYKTYSNGETFYGTNKTITKYPADASLKNYTIALSGNKTTYDFTGSQIRPSISFVKDKNGNTIRANSDYTVTYGNNISAGTGTITIKGTGKFKDSKTVKFTITAPKVGKPENFKVISKLPESINVAWKEVANVTGYKLSVIDLTTNNTANPIYTTKTSYNISKLTNAHRYVISVEAYIKDKNNKMYYGSSASLNEIWTPVKNLADYNITLSNTSFSYTGNQIKPTIKLIKDDLGNTIREHADYEVSYSNNTKVGKAYVTVKGIGAYTGTQTISFTIKKA